MIRVLIVDDEKLIREGLAGIIDWEEIGYEIVGYARNGEEALEVINETAPDVVITDIQMPRMDGIALIEAMSKEYPDIRVIILSGYGEFEYASKAMRNGVKYYLLKPFSEEKLLEVLELIKKDLNGIPIQPVQEEETNEKSSNKWIKDILRVVDENLDKPELSLKWIANEFIFVNPGYLSRIFNKEMNDTFPHYVMERRMELAKKLIGTSESDKVYQVAEKIGLGNNPQYFSQLFKNYTGYTPKEYKMKRQKGEFA